MEVQKPYLPAGRHDNGRSAGRLIDSVTVAGVVKVCKT